MQKSLLLSVSLFFSTFCAAQQFEWAGQLGGNGWDSANKLAKDSSGAVYSAGTFNSTGDFDPGAATTNLVSAGNQDIFLVKLNAAGVFSWARSFGGVNSDYGDAIATTPTADIYVGGKFSGTCDFEPGPGTNNIVSAGSDDAYICKLDSSGNVLWVHSAGSTGVDHVTALATDAAGGVYAFGLFSGTVDFDPGPGVAQLTASSGDLFIWKLDAAGNFLWAQRYGSSPGEYAGDICVDATGNIFASGGFYGTVDFDPGATTFNMTASGFYDDAFLFKLDPAGNFLWAKQFGGSSGNDVVYALAVDAAGYPHISGSFNGAGDYDPGASVYTLTSAGSEDIFVVKLTPAGNFVWAKSAGDVMLQQVYDMTVHPSGDVYMTGIFDGTVDFDPGPGSSIIASSGGGDIYILQLDSSGTFRWAHGFGDTQTDFGVGIMALNGKLVVSGSFSWTADFDPGAGVYPLTSVSSSQDGFVMNVCASYNIPVATEICSGDSLYAGGDWQTIAGVYTDTFLSVYGCDSIITTTLAISIPVVTLGNDTSVCEDEMIVLDAGNPGAIYQWNTGATTQTLTADSSGNYSVMITDATGCMDSDTINITMHALPVVTFATLALDTLCLNDGAFALSGGAPAGGTYSGPGVNAGQFDPGTAGAGLHTLIYAYSDSNSCAASDSQLVYVDICTGIMSTLSADVNVFPNPTSGVITVILPADALQPQFVLISVTGQVIDVRVDKNTGNTFVLDLQDVDSGIYFLEVKWNDSARTIKLVRE